MRKHLPAVLLLLITALPLAGADPFYSAIFERGRASYNTGNHANAVRELRIASFGLLDEVPAYEVAQVYLTLAATRMNDRDVAARAVQQLVEADAVRRSYASLNLPPAIRSAFETAAAAHLASSQLAELRGGAPAAVAAAPQTATAPPAQLPSDLATLESLSRQYPESAEVLAALAAAQLDAGHESEARRMADLSLARQSNQPTALLVLGRIAAREDRWSDAITRFEASQDTRPLGEWDLATLFVSYVNAARWSDATRIRNGLTVTTTAMPSVRSATQRLDAHNTPPSTGQSTTEAVAAKPQPERKPVEKKQETRTEEKQKPAEEKRTEEKRTEEKRTEEKKKPEEKKPAQNTTPPPAQPAPVKTTPPAKPVESVPTGTSAPTSTAPPATSTQPQTPPRLQSKISGSTGSASPAGKAMTTAPTAAAADTPEADRALREGRIIEARRLYMSAATSPAASRATLLSAARGLTQTGAYRDASAAYDRAGRLVQGEELHLFYKAVILYEAGNYPQAKQYLALAVPHIQQTREVAQYRQKIESAGTR